jgi:hypothetical protein
VEHGRGGRLLGVGVVVVPGLEEAGALVVESAEGQVAELRADLVRHHEAGIDDLARLGVAERAAVLRAAHGILDRAEQARHRVELRIRVGRTSGRIGLGR